MSDDSASIEDLVADFIDLRESGSEISVEEFASRYPEAGDELVEALERLAETESLFPSDSTVLPSRVGPYSIRGEIGRGGMGLVLEAEHVDHPGEPIALKILSLASKLDRRAMQRFKREGKILSSLDHENIVRVREFGKAAGSPFIAMEKVDGHALSRLIQEARPEGRDALAARLGGEDEAPLVRIATCVGRLADAVQAAHDVGLLHRDLKPGNVMIRRDGSPVLLDFGLAGDKEEPSLTRTGDVVGTPQYMAPEQARGERATRRTDIYGLGAILYEMVTLSAPHAGTDSGSILDRVKSRPLASICRSDRTLPRDLETIVLSSTAFDPRDRYGSAAEMAADLRAFAQGRGIAASRPSLTRRAAQWVRPRRVMIGAAAALVVVAVLVSFLVFREEPVDTERLIAEAFDDATEAWTETDLASLGAAADRILELDPASEMGRFLRDLADDRVTESSSDPLVAALIKAENKRRQQGAGAAVVLFREALDVDPSSAMAGLMLGMVALEAGNLDLAKRELEYALRNHPDSVALNAALGKVDYRRRDFGNAVSRYRMATENDPTNVDHWHNLARALFYSKDYEAGLSAVRTAIEKLGAKGDEIMHVYGVLLDSNLRRSEAQTCFREILERNPSHRKTMFSLAISLDYEHKMREAREQYQNVLVHHPKSADAHFQLAHMYSGASRHECEECRIWFERNPRDLDPERAMSHLASYLRLDRGRSAGATLYTIKIARRIRMEAELMNVLREVREECKKRLAAGKKSYRRRLDVINRAITTVQEIVE